MHDAMAALDIKANDFRARHKPPAKALDFLASGLPVIVNRGSSTDMHLQTLGYNPIYSDISSMTEPSFNTDGVRRIAIRLREQLSLEIVSRQIDTVLQSVVSETTVGNPRTQ